MIPAKSSCPSSWTKQYAEFLTSGGSYPDHYGAKYLCLDENPEYMTDVARQHEENGRLFYPVHAVCGSLPCPPYQNSQTIACVVCTKIKRNYVTSKKNYVCCIFLTQDFYIDPKIFPEVIVGVIVLVQKYKKPISIFNTSFSRILVI